MNKLGGFLCALAVGFAVPAMGSDNEGSLHGQDAGPVDLNELRDLCRSETQKLAALKLTVNSSCAQFSEHSGSTEDEESDSWKTQIEAVKLKTCEHIIKKIDRDTMVLNKRCGNLLLQSFRASEF